ncbi:hypothetical protein RKD18_000224 [Streptomyces phaeoluteigriseus]
MLLALRERLLLARAAVSGAVPGTFRAVIAWILRNCAW